MLSREIRFIALGLAALVVAGGVASWCGTLPHAAAAEGNTKVKALQRERHAILEKLAEATNVGYRNGTASLSQVVEANRAALNAELDLCETDKARVMVLEKMLTAAKDYEGAVEAKRKAVQASYADALKATADRLEVEIALERAKAK
jgi:hypothetical protein